jgi:hypothetical protein
MMPAPLQQKHLQFNDTRAAGYEQIIKMQFLLMKYSNGALLKCRNFLFFVCIGFDARKKLSVFARLAFDVCNISV